VTPHERRMERLVALAFAVTMVTGVALLAVYGLGGQTQVEGVLLAICLASLGFGIVAWAEHLMRTPTSIEERHPFATGAGGQSLSAALDEEAGFTRRRFLVGMLIGALGGLAAALAIPASIGAMGAVSGLNASGRPGAIAAPWRGIAWTIGWSRLIGAGMALLAVCLLLIAAAPVDHLATAALGSVRAPVISEANLGCAVGAALAASLVLGWIFGRRLGLPIIATAAAALPALGAAGLLVTSFQEGRYETFLDYSSNGVLQLGSIVAVASIVAALCASQAVALACSARQTTSRADPVDWVSEALARCGPASAASCLAGIAAGIALGFASERFLKEFGLGVAAGLTLELLIVQVLVAPALLRLTYRRLRDQ
jgi:hypothetical protein